MDMTNADWRMIESLRDALAGAEEDAQPLFEQVGVGTCARQTRESSFGRWPLAVVRFVSSSRAAIGDDAVGCVLLAELTFAAQGPDDDDRLQAVLRLRQAAQRAIEAAGPSGSSAWACPGHYHRRLEWHPPCLDADAAPPWVVLRQQLAVAFVLQIH